MGSTPSPAPLAWLALFAALACTDGGESGESGGAAGTSLSGGASGSAAAGAGRGGGSGSGGSNGAEAGRESRGGGAGRSGAGGRDGSAGSRADGGSSGSRDDAGSAGSGASGGVPSAGGAGEAGSESGGSSGTDDGSYWRPSVGPHRWQWQLSKDVGAPLSVEVYDIDWEASASDVARLHDLGIFVICYVSVGSWEDFRPDAADFPVAVIGNDYEGWPGEKYVDIRADSLRQLMLQRFDSCRDKGFDAIEPDNMDVFELGSDSGFPLTRADGIEYARFLAEAAHTRGLGIGQKNAASITSEIEADYQWALTESCYSDGAWCDDVAAYALADKPVFMCEYEAESFEDACSYAASHQYSAILKNLDLDAEVTFCP